MFYKKPANFKSNFNCFSLEPDFQAYSVQQPLSFELKSEMDGQPDFVAIADPQQVLVENNSIRDKPLDPEFIDNYLQKNRHRVRILTFRGIYLPMGHNLKSVKTQT